MRGIIFFAAVFAHARQGDYCVINTYLKVDLYECGRPFTDGLVVQVQSEEIKYRTSDYDIFGGRKGPFVMGDRPWRPAFEYLS